VVAPRSSWALCGLGMLLLILPWACSVELPNPFTLGSPFIVKGTAELRTPFGGTPCPVWVDSTGVVYHLFQTDAVTNTDFDRITTTGVTSRLRLAVRDDLKVGCDMGPTVEVKEVLEIIQ